MVKLETEAVVPGVMEDAEKEQAALGGRPDEQANDTGFENAP